MFSLISLLVPSQQMTAFFCAVSVSVLCRVRGMRLRVVLTKQAYRISQGELVAAADYNSRREV